MYGRLALAVLAVLAAGGAAAALALPGGGHAGVSHATVSQAVAVSAQAARPRPRRPRRGPARATAAHVYATSTPPASESHCRKAPPPVPEQPITHRRWLHGVTITEYYPAPERWF